MAPCVFKVNLIRPIFQITQFLNPSKSTADVRLLHPSPTGRSSCASPCRCGGKASNSYVQFLKGVLAPELGLQLHWAGLPLKLPQARVRTDDLKMYGYPILFAPGASRKKPVDSLLALRQVLTLNLWQLYSMTSYFAAK